MKKITVCGLVVCLSMLSGCNITQHLKNGVNYITNVFTSPEVTISYVRPANISGTENMKRIAVMEQKNDSAVSFIEHSLSGIRFDSSPYFMMVDRSTIDKIIKEQKFSDGIIADSNTRVKFGKLSGADTVISGVLNSNTNTNSYSKTVSKCSDSKCKKTYEATVSCNKRTVIGVFEAKAVSVETGEILFSKNYTHSADSDVCRGDGDSQLSSDELEGLVFGHISELFKKDVAPYRYSVDVELIESDNSKMSKNSEKYFDMGIEFAEKNSISNACKMFANAQKEYASSIAITYNNGVCAEYEGDLEKAQALYESAEMLSDNIDKLKFAMDAQDRLNIRKAHIETLRKLKDNGRI